MARKKRGFLADVQHQRMVRERDQRKAAAAAERRSKQLARERERGERERRRSEAQAAREQREQYVLDRQADAAELTRAITDRVAELESVLTEGLSPPAVVFDQWRQVYQAWAFVPPAGLATAEPEPTWADFQPRATGLGRLFKGRGRAVDEARERFAAARAEHRRREVDRTARLQAARTAHERSESARREQIDQHNATVDRLERDVSAGTPAAVEEFFELVLEGSELPDDLPVDVEVAYQADSCKLLINRDLPPVEVVPAAVSHTYVKSRDEIIVRARPAKDIHQRYSGLVARLVLRTMSEAFAARPAALVDEIAVSGYVATIDKATGRPERRCLVSASATREQFAGLVLADLDPVECLRHLNALVSPHPWELEAVRPIFDPDLSRYRFVDAHDAAARLDARPVLLEQHPTEFEHLVRQLFEAMGMKSWVTQASRDDGVDGVAVNEDPIMGGVCVIQAKRYKGVVPADAVRALAGVMDDKRASRGVLVTTSWFGKATHDFAARHGRIQLIQGEELVHLIATHLGIDVVIGELNRRRRAV